jgi:hypothetical protein
MGTRDRAQAMAIATAFVLGLSLARTSRAYDKSTCVAAYEEAQKDRMGGKLRLSREQLLICAHVTCPDVVARDCRTWRNEVEGQLASIALTARDLRGTEVSNVRVLADGELIVDELDGRPIFVDAGPHTFRFERRGSVPLEQRIKLEPGERQHLVDVKLMPSGSEEPRDAPIPKESPKDPLELPGSRQESRPLEPLPATAPPDRSSREKSPTTVVYVLGGIGIVSLVSFAYLGFTGESDVSRLREECAPRCAKSEVDAVRTKLIAANISLGVGLAALGASGFLWLSAGAPSSRPTMGLDVRPVAGGGMGSLVGSF